MDQDEGAGHHAITADAVRQLFEARADEDGLVDGMTQDQYAEALDAAQEHQDRIPGPTMMPAWLDGDAQREHGMADPDRSGEENRVINRDYVESEVHAARAGDEMTHLGNAAHALEDSYSGAHAFRDQEALAEGDPTAAIESLNVFDPLPNLGMGTLGVLTGEEGTHDHRFDHVEVDESKEMGEAGRLVEGDDQAAANAVARMLIAHEEAEDMADETDARDHVNDVVDEFYRPADGGVDVNLVADEEWRAERDERLGIDHEVTTGDQIMDAVREGYGAVTDFVTETVPEAVGNAAEAVGEFVTETVPEAVDDAVEAVTDFASDVWESITG